MLSPDRFIPVAERSGLIDMLGRFMLETTCAHARRWSDTTPGADLYIAVNVSPRQVRREGFVDYVLGLLRSHGLPADMLVLELTERVVIEADVIEPLAVLRRAGVRVALDDFGQGYTSFGALSRMPIDILKIDRAFISELHRKPQQAAIVRTMISLGHDLGLTVVAEGVESVEESDHLSTLRCDCVQGYQFHAPMTAEAFGALSAAPQRGDGRAAIAPSRYPQAGAHPMMAGD
jgi:EAL domain-containing protein (putative c-di-GMP-specific phosphodiesterase class I)